MNAIRTPANELKELRRNASPAQTLLWQQLRGKRFGGFKCRRQHPFGPNVVDSYGVSAGIVVELVEPVQTLGPDDFERIRFIESKGAGVVRLSADEVLHNLPATLRKLSLALPQ